MQTETLMLEVGGVAGGERHAERLPLWLSEAEAEGLLALCAASPASAGDAEGALFARMGELLRAFRS